MQNTSKPLRIVFAGTPGFSALHLQALCDAGHSVVAAYTQPDRPGKRGKQPLPSPVKQLANSYSIPVCQPASLRSGEAATELAGWQADVMVVVAYGLLLPQAVLDTPRLGCINVHASLLPTWRGAAPIERAIEAGDRHTGVTIMQMDAGLDSGDMLLQAACDITGDDTGDSLRAKLAVLGCDALLTVLAQLCKGEQVATPQQNSLKTYAHKLTKEEAQIDWSQDAAALARRIRAFHSANVMFADLDGTRVKVWQATPIVSGKASDTPGKILAADKNHIIVACGNGALALQQLQLPGGKVQGVAAVLNGHGDKFQPGLRFSCGP